MVSVMGTFAMSPTRFACCLVFGHFRKHDGRAVRKFVNDAYVATVEFRLEFVGHPNGPFHGS
jgi:hypothetical protein